MSSWSFAGSLPPADVLARDDEVLAWAAADGGQSEEAYLAVRFAIASRANGWGLPEPAVALVRESAARAHANGAPAIAAALLRLARPLPRPGVFAYDRLAHETPTVVRAATGWDVSFDRATGRDDCCAAVDPEGKGVSLFAFPSGERLGHQAVRAGIPADPLLLPVPGRRLVATIDRAGLVRIYDFDAGAELGRWATGLPVRGECADELRLAYRTEDGCLFVGGARGKLLRYRLGARLMSGAPLTPGRPRAGTLGAIRGELHGFVLTPDGTRLVVSTHDGWLGVVDAVRLPGTPHAARCWQAHETCINTIALSPDGQVVVSGSQDSSVALFSLTGDELWRFETPAGVQHVTISPDGATLALGGNDDVTRLYDLRTLAMVGELPHGYPAFSGTGAALVLRQDDYRLAVYRAPEVAPAI